MRYAEKPVISIDTTRFRHSARSTRRTLCEMRVCLRVEMIITGRNNVGDLSITATTNPVLTEYRARMPFHILQPENP